MASPNLTIRIGVDASGVTQGVQQTTQQINSIGTQAQSARNGMNGLNESMRAAGGAGAGLARPTSELRRMQQQASDTSGAVNQLKSAFGGLIAMFGASQLMKQMDEWAALEGRLKIVSNSYEELRSAQAGLSQIAQATRTDLVATTTLYFKMASALKDTGMAQAELFRLTETTNKAIIISGSGAMEAKASLLQFGQALASNRLGGDELRSMAEQTPRLVQAIREGLGLTQAEFKKTAEAGGLKTEVVTGALTKMKDKIDAEFRVMPLTIGQAFTLVDNSMTEFIGKGGQASGAAQGIANSIQFLANHLTELVQGLEIAISTYAAYKVAAIASTIATEGFTIALLANPISRVATLIGAAIGTLYAFKDSMITVGDTTASVGAIVQSVWNNVKQSVGMTIDWIGAKVTSLLNRFSYIQTAFNQMKSLFNGASFDTGDFGKTMSGMADSIISNAKNIDTKIADERKGIEQKTSDEIAGLKETEAEKIARKANEAAKKSAQVQIDFEKDNASESRKLQIKETEEIAKWKKEFNRDLSKSELESIHNTVYAGEIKKAQSASMKAAHKEETEAAREAKKEQDGFNKLIESTPIGAYNAKVSELNNALQKGGIDQQTYNDLMTEAAAKYEKGTVGIDKMTAAEKERQRVFEGTARGKFEKSTDELRLAKPNMSEAEYANKQDKIGVDYLHESGLNKDAKTKIDAATEATKAFEEATKKAGKASFDLGSQGSMAFDGLLGGISAMTGAFENMSDTLEKHKTKFDEIGTTYAKNMQMEGMTTEQRSALTKQYYDDKKQYEDANLNSSLAGMRQIAGATSKMFSENSSARKAMHAVEMGLSVIEIAMTLKKTVAKVAEGASTMFAQSGWAGFAGVGAMVAVMAGLGFAMAGGSSKEPVLPEHTKTTGTVLGDSEAQTHAITNIVSKLDEIHASEYPELRNIASSMNELKTSIGSMVANLFKSGGIKMASVTQPNNDHTAAMMGLSGAAALYSGVSAGVGVAGALTASGLVSSGMAAGVGLALGAATMGIGLVVSAALWALSKVPVIGDIINGITSFISNGLFGKKTVSVKDGGVNINQQSMGSVIDSGMIDGQVSTIIDTKKSSWFSTSHKISEILTTLDDSVKSGLGKVFSSMAVSVGTFWDFIGGDVNKGLEKIRSFVIPFANIKTFGLKDTDIQKAFEDYSSMTFDNLVKHVFGGFVSQFQAAGESLGDTMSRVITDTAQVKSAFVKMGADMTQTNDHLLVFSESMISMAGGLKNLIALADNFTSKFTSKDVKNKLSIEQVTAFINDKGDTAKDGTITRQSNLDVLKSLGLDTSVPESVLALVNNKAATSADVARAKDSLGQFAASVESASSKLSASSDKYTLNEASATKAFEHAGTPTVTEQKVIDALNRTGVYPITNSTTLEEANAMNGGKVDFSKWIWGGKGSTGTGLESFLSANSATKAEGLSELSAAGLPTDQKTYAANKAAEAEVAKPVEALLLNTLQLADSFATITDNVGNYAKIVEATANITKTAGDNINATRANEIAGLSTQNEKDAKAVYNTTLDTKKFADDTIAAEQRIYDLRHKAGDIAVAELNRNIVKIKNEATATDTLNGYTQKRIDLLNQEFAATQFSAYDKKLQELKTGVANLGVSMTETDTITNTLKLGIQDLRDTYVEVTDATGKVINPVSQLIELLIDTQVATSLKANADALKSFGKSVKDWVLGMKTTSVGNAKSQMTAAQADFDKNYNIITDKTDKYTNVQKSEAMSGMTASADKLVASIHKYGANGDEAQSMIKSVMSKMTALPEVATMQELSFDALKESNGILTTIADNTKPIKDTKALTFLESLEASSKITQTAANTKSTADALAQIKGSQSDLSNKIDGINVNFSEIKTAPIEIKPITMSLDTTGLASILNSELITLQNIYSLLGSGVLNVAANGNGGGSGITNTGANSGNNNVINMTIAGGIIDGSTTTPSVDGSQTAGEALNKSIAKATGNNDTVKPYFTDGSGTGQPPEGYIAPKNSFISGAQKDKDAVNAAMYGMSTKDYIAGGRTGLYATSGNGSSTMTSSSAPTPQINSTNNGGSNLNVIINNNTVNDLIPPPKKKSLFNEYSYYEYQALDQRTRQNDFNNADNPSFFGSGERQFLNEQYKLSQLSYADYAFNSTGAPEVLVSGTKAKKELGYFAKGGISNEPAIFGEAGWEAAVPLPDGRTIPVTIHQTHTPQKQDGDVVATLVECTDALLEALARLQNATTSGQQKITNATQQNSEKTSIAHKAWALN